MDSVPYPRVFDPELKCWKVNLPHGAYTLVDDEDLWLLELAAWHSHHQFKYVHTNIALHRLIMRAKPGMYIDHINGNKFDNRRSNLRPCNKSENARNRGKFPRWKNKFKGVYKTGDNRFSVDLKLGKGKRIHIGTFDIELVAAAAYDTAAIEHFGEFARTNESLGLYKKSDLEGLELGPKAYKPPTSKFKGVSKVSKGPGYIALITHKKVRYYLGYFQTAEEAARAYDAKAIELHGEFAVTNASLGLYDKS